MGKRGGGTRPVNPDSLLAAAIDLADVLRPLTENQVRSLLFMALELSDHFEVRIFPNLDRISRR